MAITITRSANYDKNAKLVHGNDVPCIVCGKPIKPSSGSWLHVFDGLLAVTEDEAQRLNAIDGGASDLGAHPVGADCLRKNPELKAYIQE